MKCLHGTFFLLILLGMFSCKKAEKTRCAELRDNIIGAWNVIATYVEVRGDSIYQQTNLDLPGSKDIVFYEDGTGLNYMSFVQGGQPFDWEFKCEDQIVNIAFHAAGSPGGIYVFASSKSFDVEENKPKKQRWESSELEPDSAFVYLTFWNMTREY